jgi:hypothetical protein
MFLATFLSITGMSLLAAIAPADAFEPSRSGARTARAQDDGDACEATARAARMACRFDALGEYWIGMGVCTNLSDGGDRDECKTGAAESLAEERETCGEQYDARLEVCDLLGEDRYDPEFDPANFVHPDDIGGSVAPNPYFPIVAGNEWVYESGDETVTVTVTHKTKSIAGVTCRVVLDVVEVDGFPVEVTDDWFAQDLEGNVWYCGESVRDFEVFDGDEPVEAELVSIDGSFKVGREGAKPGIIMLAHPMVGDAYREEAALGEAEDVAEILSINATESTPAASCDGDCVVTRNFQALDPGVEEFKYYAPGVGFILELGAEGERVELVSFTTP